jgi:hypothetical protein
LKFETPGGEKQTIFKLSLYKVEDPNVKKYICMFYSSSASHYSSVYQEKIGFILDNNMITALNSKIDPEDKQKEKKTEFEIKPMLSSKTSPPSLLNKIGDLFDIIQGQSEE